MRLASRVLALLLPISSAALADDQEQCFKAEGQDSIIACMRLIDSGKLQGRELAVAHLSSGLAWSKLGDLGRAIRKYSEAIQVDPSYVIALNNRCAVYNRQREFDRAIQDCERAISLDPSYVNAYVGRGDVGVNVARVETDRPFAVLNGTVELTLAIIDRASVVKSDNVARVYLYCLTVLPDRST